MSETFRLYEREAQDMLSSGLGLLSSARGSGADTGTVGTSALSATAHKEVDALLAELQALVRSMELEAASHPSRRDSDIRKSMDARVGDVRAQIVELRAQLKHDKQQLQSRMLLDGGGGGSSAATREGDRRNMQKQTEQLERASERVKESQRVAADTELMGAQILSDLSGQGAVLARARENLGGVNEDLTRSHGVMGAINRREFTNRLVMYSVAAAVVLVLLIVLFFRFNRHS
ncbi:Vesicle transport v-SNARE 13 [Porphyridium purpureum]|uniref:Vesicle transport v-SNARE 13 n=1 Tax=Porphyridium purpureum TaxID=35688 RepID=A0A5J4Z335_PORPP|nr:Vesicle transport v-SNARE 13 [Porphyridium purpureum]|eukprot:POR4849..scf295_1